ncbi:MAG: hypothetical protein U0T82_06825 [Bacteroidales bacterium]
MADKKAYVLRIDSRKLAAIEKWAADEFRSTNGQLEWVIEQALKKAGRWPDLKKQNDENIHNDQK